MRSEDIKLVIGALLHDIGKVIHRQGGDKRNHSQSGYEYLRDEIGLKDGDILDSVRYHHQKALRDAAVEDDSLSYIVYIADNIASAADRRDNDTDAIGFDIHTPLQSIFNKLNGNNQNYYFEPTELDAESPINYPTAAKKDFGESLYADIKNNITNNLLGIEFNDAYVGSLLESAEANLSYVPSSTSNAEVPDISLYDHVKLTAAAASCIYRYLEENGEKNYREILFLKSKEFYGKKAFMLFSMDISGIQNFIYTITSENALKTLRARSFYLEIMMEDMIDGLLENLGLSRANLIYSGGGHCYILLPNTAKTKSAVDEYMKNINTQLLDKFRASLFVGHAYAPCSSNNLKNEPSGSYSEIFKRLGDIMSERKSSRYTAEQIIALSNLRQKDYTRECKICKSLDNLTEKGVCGLCERITAISKNILYDEFFSIVSEEQTDSLPLPTGHYLLADKDRAALENRMCNDKSYIRTYSKNKQYTGQYLATKLWVGDYKEGSTFEDMASKSEGIKRIGILRADVDNLGHALVAGFNNPANQNKYVTLSRTASLSRQMSLFFKLYINRILENPEFCLTEGKTPAKRNASIVYSGGDDIFIAGAWNDILEFAVDLQKAFRKFTQGMLTLSAGFGIYRDSYPISASASEVEELESQSKKKPRKNSVTLFPDNEFHEEEDGDVTVLLNDGTYSWDEFTGKVCGEKLKTISDFFRYTEEHGNSFLYHILELVRNSGEKINIARCVYLLARLEPCKDRPAAEKERYRKLSDSMYRWLMNGNEKDRRKDIRELKTAIMLYVYLNRKDDSDNE